MINSLYKVISCKWQKPILITAKMKEHLMQEYLADNGIYLNARKSGLGIC
jgi:hypothetical protein